ncbi:glycosyltransferase family 2 protein [Streptomyces sp. MS1.AVA.4]|uniref:Glycosyltransferase family 2 protein n=1 Tax=Streptomyces pratisoli TaxID=3139917 RepID=A0ACC6QT15_9ACTN
MGHGVLQTDGYGAGVKLGVAILTMGTRPKELAELLASVRAQTAPAVRTVVVANGCAMPDLPPWVETVQLAENLGVTGGRNAALEYLGDMDLVLDLDDDGLLVSDDVFATITTLYEADPQLGIVGFRIADETGVTQRRHVPRLRAGDPMRAGLVTGFLGGAHVLSTRMLEEVGHWPDAFFFAHEETDMAWRAIDSGWRVRYEPRLLLQHPRTSPARHAFFYQVNARNRVYLARRHLPAVLVPVYLGMWVALTLARTRSLAGLRAWFGGFAEGWRTECGPRRPMRWGTVFTLARLGRPPVI